MKPGTARQIIILGAGVMQGPLIETAKEMGLETIVVDGDPGAPNARRGDRFEAIDLKDREGVEALARSLREGGRLGGIVTAGTDFSATVAWAAERLGLPGIPYETALNATDKGRMRRCFKAAGVPSPEFIVLDRRGMPDPSGPDFSPPFDYPLVVKPVDNMGARGCRRIDSPGDLGAALESAFSFSRSGQVILEEYMEGPEYSVDALVYHGEITICGLADRHIFFPPYFIEMGHTIPAAICRTGADPVGADDNTEAEILGVFTQGARALGLLSGTAAGAAKGDIKLTPRGPMIGEIAARLSGGYMSGWTWPYASGADPARGAIMAALGERPGGLVPARNWTCAERAFISIPGRVRAIIGSGAAKAAPYVKDLFLRVEPGARVRFPENNVSKCGNILAAAPDRETAAAAAESATRGILIALEAPDGETAAFLKGDAFLEGDAFPGTEPRPGLTENPGPAENSTATGNSWPPPAFAITPEIASALGELPDPDPVAPGSPDGTLPEGPALIPFPALAAAGLRDWMGRSLAETLDAVRRVTRLALPELPWPGAETAGRPFLGRRFWAALIRGGYQGAAYRVECLFRRELKTGTPPGVFPGSGEHG